MEQKKPRTGEYVAFIIGSILLIYISWHCIVVYDAMPEPELLPAIMDGFTHMETYPFVLPITKSFLGGMGYIVMIDAIAFIAYFSIYRKTMFGKEQGSAEWAKKEVEKKLRDMKNFYNNIIFSKNVLLSMNTRKTRLNNNVVVVGGSGSGKTRFFAKPNIMQAGCSYLVTDPKGELLKSTGSLLEEEGYEVKVFNLIEKDHSCCYNPFVYIHKESDVFKLIKQLIKNTNPPDKGGGADPFWEKSEEALLQAIFFYLWLECPQEQQNFKTVMSLIRLAGASEEDENAESDLDIMFRLLEEKKGAGYIPCKQYKIFKMASGKTAKSILISVGVRLSVFNLQDIENLTLTDNLDLKAIGDKKTVLYIVIPDSDPSFNFLVSMLYSQAFDELYFQADFGELKWNDNKILYRSKESLLDKKKKIMAIYEDYEKTNGEIKKEELRKTIISTLESIKQEFGLPYTLPDNKDKTIKKNYIEQYIRTMDSCLIRLRNRKSTLNAYMEDWKEAKKSLKLISESKSEYKEKSIEKIQKKIDALEMRIEYEYGLKKILPEKKNFAIKFLHMKPQYTNSDYKQADKEYFEDLKFLTKELERNPQLYGTRQDFDEKIKKINKCEANIKQFEKEINETGRLQRDLRNELREKIVAKKRDIKRIEIIAQYEFGVKNLKVRKNGGRLPVPVRCILDEFANIAPIPDFSKLVATMRSREISVSIIVQNISQLKEMYKDNWESLTGNCDSFLFLGGQEQSTLEYVSKKLGKATIDKRSQGKSKGKQGSSSENWDSLGRELMTPDEIGKMNGTNCILFIRGFSPFWCEKYPLEKHPNYERIGEPDNPSDPRIFDFQSKFNTKEFALGVHGEQLGVNKEFRKLLEASVEDEINRIDKQHFFNHIVTMEERQTFNLDNTLSDRSAIDARKEKVHKQIEYQFIKLAKVKAITADMTAEEIRELIQETLKKQEETKKDIQNKEQKQNTTVDTSVFDERNTINPVQNTSEAVQKTVHGEQAEPFGETQNSTDTEIDNEVEFDTNLDDEENKSEDEGLEDTTDVLNQENNGFDMFEEDNIGDSNSEEESFDGNTEDGYIPEDED